MEKIKLKLGTIEIEKENYLALREYFSHREIIEEIRMSGMDEIFDLYHAAQACTGAIDTQAPEACNAA